MSLSGRLYDLGEGDLNNKDNFDPNIYWGIVVVAPSNDPSGAGRCKVRIRELDKEIRLDSDLPWVNPMLPKFLGITPKRGETVKVFTFDRKNTRINRFFIGPLISQPQKFEFDPHFYESRSGLDQGLLAFKKAWFLDPQARMGETNWAVIPSSEDIALNGRKNEDFMLRYGDFYDEVIFRSGKYDPKKFTKLNEKNPGYLSVVYLQEEGIEQQSSKKFITEDRSHINVVADQINLISHKGSNKKGNAPAILNSDDPEKQILTENNKLHEVPYGDMFWEFVTRVKDFVESHIHEGGGVAATPPDKSGPTQDLLNWINTNIGTKSEKENPDGSKYTEYESNLLSKGIKIN